jgi:DNA adenine methylase
MTESTANSEPIVKAVAPWFGGKRTLGSKIVAQLGKHTQYFEPFCGSMAVLFAKSPSQKETVNDLHCDLINLAEVLQNIDDAERLYGRLQSSLFSEGLLDQARIELDGCIERERCEDRMYAVNRAYWYFLASWMGRNGTAGTARVDYQIAVRWTKNGGSPTVRFRHAVDSIPAWHQRLRNVVILNRDAFRIIDRFEDCAGTVIYADPPYAMESRGDGAKLTKASSSGKYLHEFEHDSPMFGDDHDRLAEILKSYKHARIVVSYYDCPRVRQLYEGWTFIDCSMQKNLHAQNGRGARPKTAPELLIVNGPVYE